MQGLWVPAACPGPPRGAEGTRGPGAAAVGEQGTEPRGQTGDSACPGHRRAAGKRSQNVTGARCARKAAAEPEQGTGAALAAQGCLGRLSLPPRGDASPLPAVGTSAPTRTWRGRAACGAHRRDPHAELRFLPESPSSVPLCPLPSPTPAAGRPQQPLAVTCPYRVPAAGAGAGTGAETGAAGAGRRALTPGVPPPPAPRSCCACCSRGRCRELPPSGFSWDGLPRASDWVGWKSPPPLNR